MKVKFIEAHDATYFNYGKFLVAQFENYERGYIAQIGSGYPLLASLGWSPRNIIVLDLSTGEGARFLPGGIAEADLHKHKIWVCPLFEPFLTWLYDQDLSDLDNLPKAVNLGAVPIAMYGYRREGVILPRRDAKGRFVGKKAAALPKMAIPCREEQ